MQEHEHTRGKRWARAAPLLTFVLLGLFLFWNAMGDDLASSYVGCRIVATGATASLYSHDPVNFAGIADTDTIWPRLAAEGHYAGYLHPYVQTPLWAWGLQPLCNHLAWPPFKHLFLLLALSAIAGIVYLVAWLWTPRLFTPLCLFLILGLLAFSEPFLFAMQLVQTHALLLLLTVAGLMLAERRHPVLGGLCVACAAAVKLTPGIFVLYWVAARRWRAAISFGLWSALLLLLTRWVVGASLFAAYVQNLHRVSAVLLVSENNQSLAAWWMGRFFAPDEIFDVNAFALPHALSTLSTALMGVFAVLGGVLDRRRAASSGQANARQASPPIGAAITLVAMTIFAPIAWTHYFILLVVPLMLLAQAAFVTPLRLGRVLLAGCMLGVIALFYRPLAPDVVHMDLSDFALLRGTWFAGVLTLLGLLGITWLQRRPQDVITT